MIQVITGKGNHSFNGRPRIKPAVITYIKKKKFGFGNLSFLPYYYYYYLLADQLNPLLEFIDEIWNVKTPREC